jgi:hypothetical protein
MRDGKERVKNEEGRRRNERKGDETGGIGRIRKRF